MSSETDQPPHVAPPVAREEAPVRVPLAVVAVPIVAVVVAGYVASALWARLLNGEPLVLLALSPVNRYLLLTTNSLSWWSYFGVGLARHLFPDPFFYLLGLGYGDRAIAWAAETYPVVRRFVGSDGRGLEHESNRKILYPLAFLAPNNWVSLLAGSARLPFRAFIILNITGTVARLVLFRWLGVVFHSQIRTIADWIGRYSLPVTGLSVVLVLVAVAWQFRRGTGELVGLTHLSEELDD